MSFRLLSPFSTTKTRTPASDGSAPLDWACGLRSPSASGAARIRTPSSGPVAIVTVNVLPLPISLATPIPPPRACAIRRLIVSPRPVPPNWRVTEVVGLNEGIENRLELVGGNAHARIDHIDRESRIELVRDEPAHEFAPCPPG